MPVPNTFANATTTIPLSDLDNNFATPITIGNTAIQLGNTVTTLNNMTLANVTISSAATPFPNNLLANSAVTIGNTSVSLGSTQGTFGNVTLQNVTISSVSTPLTVDQGGTGVATLAAENVVIGNAANAVKTVAPGSSGNVLTSTGTTWASQAPGAITGNVTIGNTTIALGGTATTVGNLTLTNTTISSVATTFPNSYLSNSSVTIGNTSVSLGGTSTSIGNLTLTNTTISSGTITGTVSNATTDSANIVGYMGIPQNSQNGNYNVVIGDSGKHIYHPTGQAAATYTIPANSNVAFTVGSAVTIINGSANNVSIALTTDTLYLSSNGATGTRTLTQWGVATAVKITSTAWVISGSNLT
jgi:hypothetical protein